MKCPSVYSLVKDSRLKEALERNERIAREASLKNKEHLNAYYLDLLNTKVIDCTLGKREASRIILESLSVSEKTPYECLFRSFDFLNKINKVKAIAPGDAVMYFSIVRELLEGISLLPISERGSLIRECIGRIVKDLILIEYELIEYEFSSYQVALDPNVDGILEHRLERLNKEITFCSVNEVSLVTGDLFNCRRARFLLSAHKDIDNSLLIGRGKSIFVLEQALGLGTDSLIIVSFRLLLDVSRDLKSQKKLSHDEVLTMLERLKACKLCLEGEAMPTSGSYQQRLLWFKCVSALKQDLESLYLFIRRNTGL